MASRHSTHTGPAAPVGPSGGGHFAWGEGTEHAATQERMGRPQVPGIEGAQIAWGAAGVGGGSHLGCEHRAGQRRRETGLYRKRRRAPAKPEEGAEHVHMRRPCRSPSSHRAKVTERRPGTLRSEAQLPPRMNLFWGRTFPSKRLSDCRAHCLRPGRRPHFPGQQLAADQSWPRPCSSPRTHTAAHSPRQGPACARHPACLEDVFPNQTRLYFTHFPTAALGLIHCQGETIFLLEMGDPLPSISPESQIQGK